MDVPAAARAEAAVLAPEARNAVPKPCPADRADLVSAAVAAKLCGGRVEALGERSETTQVFANPDGTITEERALAPVRVRAGDRWEAVDLTLVKRPDGTVAPRVHPRALELSGAAPGTGSHEVAAFGSGGERTGFSWTGPLPEPVLDGPTATYREVQPGVDLVVTAQSTGYAQFFVAKDRAALKRISTLRLPISTGALRPAADGAGGLTFNDAKGRPVGRAQAPVMWDATVGARSGEHVNVAGVGLKVTGGRTLELTADPDFVARPDLTFPVTIDPPASLPVAFDAFVQNSYSSDQSGASELKLGHIEDGGSYTARSYLRFGTTGIHGTQITTAKLRLWNTHSYSCTAASWEAWRTDTATTATRWTAQPAAREKVGTSTETRGYSSSCGDGYVYVEVGKALQYAADNNSADVTIMLRGTSETSSASWKKFDSAEAAHPPLITVTYNAAPSVPDAPAVAPCYSSCGAGAGTSGVRPTLSVKLADTNAGQALRAEFEVRTKAAGAAVAASGTLSGSWTNGSTAAWQVSTDLVNGTTYQWRARARDPYADGAWTGWTDLTVDTDRPGVPFVSAQVYLDDGQPHGGAGQADTFTFTPAGGGGDLAAFVYRLDTDAAATTVAATGTITRVLTPADGLRTLTVQAKDRAGNLSAANTYTFSAGSAALAQPLPGATVVKRTKLEVFTPVAGYTRAYFEYRRGPGAPALPVPSANLMSATGAPVTATAASPVAFTALGGYAIWSATDTLGAVGGVVEVRARIFTATSAGPVYDTPWVRVTVDSSGDGAATDEAGPGAVNLLTGDLTLEDTDVDELGLSVSRTASSRGTDGGWTAMPQKLTANQQQVSTDLTGFAVPSTSTAVRSTARGQGDVTPADSIEITPAASGTGTDTYVALGGDTGALRLGMVAGRTYRATGWIYVPAATTLAPASPATGLRIVGFYKNGTAYTPVASPMAAYLDGWQELSVTMTIPAGATEALFRLYNGNAGGSGRKVYWDNVSVTEVVAPFGPSWVGGATGGAAESDYTTLSFTEASLAQVTMTDGSWITFSRNADGSTFTPEPGGETLSLTRPDATSYRLTEADGTVAEFTQQGGVWTVTSTWTAEGDTTSRYVYDTTGGRLLLKRVINPAEPGVGDCTTATPARGCEVLEYVHATATATGLSQTVFGDYADRVTGVRIWTWDPARNAEVAVDVARYAYDDLGRLREVWDPRITPAVKTTYEYDAVGRVVRTTPPGELPWSADYGNPDVDAAALRWGLDGNANDGSGAGRNGTATGVTWGEGNDPGNPGDRAAVFTGAAGQQITASGTALSNTASYTVSAWARITDKSASRTIVSKDGSRTSGFFLTYVADTDRWAFSRTTADADSSSSVRATSNTAPVLGRWTHLAGVHDTATGRMVLYVDGVPQSTTVPAGGWNATGGYVVGRAKWAGAAANPWAGGIDDVRIYGSALTAAQIADLAGDENGGRLLRIRRSALQPGSKTATDGETAVTLVYNTPLTRASGGPYDLDSAAIASWGQTDLPTDATAVFPAEQVPACFSARAGCPGPNGFGYATVHYLNAGGQEVNTATPGGHIDTSEYDRFGNVVRTLEASERELALGTRPGAAADLATLGLLESGTAIRALALSTVNTFGPDGTDQLEHLGPTRTVTLDRPLADPDGTGPLTARAAGDTVIARARTVSAYDEGRPDGATYHLETTRTEGASVDGYPLADARVTRTGYAAEKGGHSGWALKKPTMSIVEATPGGARQTSWTVYDAAGRITATWGIGATGTDARTTEMIYYTGGANTVDTACGNRPEWAGQLCVSRAAGAVQGHDPARMAGALPVRRITGYTRFGDEAAVTETAAGVTRTTTITFDAADREYSTLVTSDAGAALPAVVTGYDPATGRAVTSTAGTDTITREYDALGRLVAYTDADGARTSTELDRYDNEVRVVDPTGTTTYEYDRAVDPRGLLTGLTDSNAGSFTARYSPDGQLVTVTYPGGITRTDRLDANLQPAGRTYTRTADGLVIWSESVVDNSAGQWTRHQYTGGESAYAYDGFGRLVTARHDSAVTGGCLTRTYAYDDRTNRTRSTAYAPGADGGCATSTAESESVYTHDTADRITNAGFRYDALGRTVGLPDGMTIDYYANDLVRGQQLDDARQTWTLDPAHRLRAARTETLAGTTWTETATTLQHYADDSDEPRWTIEDGTGAWTRYVSGPDGDLGASVTSGGTVLVQLANLHGDVAAVIDPVAGTPEVYQYDEFGTPLAGQADLRYGWLGAKQRSGDAMGDLILMGVRLYSPGLGRFLTVDPIADGSCNAYDYSCADPVNRFDLDGRKWCWKFCKHGKNPYWRMAFHGTRIAGSAFGMLGAGVVYRGGYRSIRSGWKVYRSVRKKGWKASFHPFRTKTRREKVKYILSGIGGWMGYHDIRNDWRGFKRAARDASKPWAAKYCRGVRKLKRRIFGRYAGSSCR
ncbi:hypothetical protein JCM9534A_04210 [Catenuloplanes indicus JCM 9534]